MLGFMALEIEIKFPDADLLAVRQRLGEQGADNLGCRFESNCVLDTPDRVLRASGILLRLRQDGRTVLTLKRPPAAMGVADPGRFKVWEETETLVDDFEAMRAILSGLGFVQSLAYEKLREIWRLEGCAVCLDRLPFCDCVEIEGTEAGIEACAARLELDMRQGSAANYHQLHAAYRAARGLTPRESFIFPPGERPRMPWECGEAAS
jgi:adenylate cyclase, class 2